MHFFLESNPLRKEQMSWMKKNKLAHYLMIVKKVILHALQQKRSIQKRARKEVVHSKNQLPMKKLASEWRTRSLMKQQTDHLQQVNEI
jgi:hypothetical protein